ncbi:MAG TPA: HAD-IIIA family hydrolase [Kiritimatiellia bacterium]|nr:HAD-IIIA family hydrolase [Kiritimatiellia bacterium]HMO97750.1 HAD-IIIA family hydrolase [Kiritimatiellia bacterium]HMP95389.1 HAD-IIIA family hydrolase [Kiritimatiellia bacterium]
MKPCIFFDRDGIVNVAPLTRYVERIDDFHLQTAFFDALAIANQRGYEAVIVTNQKGVSTGFTPLAELEKMHAQIQAEAARRRLRLLDILYCDAPNNEHPRRKPNPGMLLEAAERHNLDLTASWMIGDNESDVLTGQRAGCRTIYVGTKSLTLVPDYTVTDMSEVPGLLQTCLAEGVSRSE